MPILRVIRSASAILFALVLTAAFTGCGTRADSEYEKGVEAYLRRDYANAVLHYREAAKREHAEAQFQLGCCYENGEGVPADFAEAVKWWRKAAEKSHQAARERLEELDELERCRQAAERGDAEAQYHLGRQCVEGALNADPREAAKWFRLAAEQGHAGAQFELARNLCYDNDDDDDDAEAFEWWRKAAEQGHVEAIFELADCYEVGFVVDTDPAQALEWYRLALEKGHAKAQERIDDILEMEGNRKAAEQGSADAQLIMGNYYENKYAEEAVKWFRLAADQGLARAQFMLGCHYDSGDGVEEDPAEAVKWLTLAAEQGLEEAQFQLYLHYEKGKGVPRDDAEAAKWLNRSRKWAVADTLYRAGCQYAAGAGVKKDMAKAIEYWNMAVAQDVPAKYAPAKAAAQYRLAQCLYDGDGIPENKQEAIELWRTAAENGNADAKNKLQELGVAEPPLK
jgi:TPR repeat protein